MRHEHLRLVEEAQVSDSAVSVTQPSSEVDSEEVLVSTTTNSSSKAAQATTALELPELRISDLLGEVTVSDLQIDLAKEILASLKIDRRRSFFRTSINEVKITIPAGVSDQQAAEALNRYFVRSFPEIGRDAVNVVSFVTALKKHASHTENTNQPRQIRIRPLVNGNKPLHQDAHAALLRARRETVATPWEQALIGAAIACQTGGGDIFNSLMVRGNVDGVGVVTDSLEGITLVQILNDEEQECLPVSSKRRPNLAESLTFLQDKSSERDPAARREAYLDVAGEIISSVSVEKHVFPRTPRIKSIQLTVPPGVSDQCAVQALEIYYRSLFPGIDTRMLFSEPVSGSQKSSQAKGDQGSQIKPETIENSGGTPADQDGIPEDLAVQPLAARQIRLVPVVRNTIDRDRAGQEQALLEAGLHFAPRSHQRIAAAAYACVTQGGDLFEGYTARGEESNLALEAKSNDSKKCVAGFLDSAVYDDERDSRLAASGESIKQNALASSRRSRR